MLLVLHFHPYEEQFGFLFSAFSLFSILSATTEAFIMLLDGILYFLLTELHVLCYHPSFHKSFHFPEHLYFFGSENFASLLKTDDNSSETNFPEGLVSQS
jgi:hypothetical protein